MAVFVLIGLRDTLPKSVARSFIFRIICIKWAQFFAVLYLLFIQMYDIITLYGVRSTRVDSFETNSFL